MAYLQRFGDANPMRDGAEGAMTLLVLPLSNAETECVFSAGALTKSNFKGNSCQHLFN